MVYAQQNSMYCIWLKKQANYKDSIENDDLVVNKWMLHFIQN